MATQERLGTKRLVVGSHYGTKDFIVQRVTAVIMAVYTLALFISVIFASNLDFETWQSRFTFHWGSMPIGQLFATLAFFSLAWHAWVGIRDIWMDYIHPDGWRLFLEAVSVLWLVGSVVYFVKILWSL
jgi:succinate dehydrogenase / fumarate reductase, membrane anchor subunit